MMNEFEKIQNAILEANKIIKEKGLHFRFFFETTNHYSYNNAIAHYKEYKKLSPDEYATLVYIVKRGYMK